MPPPALCVFSTQSNRIRGLNVTGLNRCKGSIALLISAGVNTPSTPGSGFIVTPLRAAAAPPSLRIRCALWSVRMRSPGSVCVRIATWLDMLPVGTNTASSLPISSAVSSSSSLTVGSSPYTSSPTAAAAIASRISVVGLVTVSLLISTMDSLYDINCGPRARFIPVRKSKLQLLSVGRKAMGLTGCSLQCRWKIHLPLQIL